MNLPCRDRRFVRSEAGTTKPLAVLGKVQRLPIGVPLASLTTGHELALCSKIPNLRIFEELADRGSVRHILRQDDSGQMRRAL